MGGNESVLWLRCKISLPLRFQLSLQREGQRNEKADTQMFERSRNVNLFSAKKGTFVWGEKGTAEKKRPAHRFILFDIRSNGEDGEQENNLRRGFVAVRKKNIHHASTELRRGQKVIGGSALEDLGLEGFVDGLPHGVLVVEREADDRTTVDEANNSC